MVRYSPGRPTTLAGSTAQSYRMVWLMVPRMPVAFQVPSIFTPASRLGIIAEITPSRALVLPAWMPVTKK